MAPLPPSPILCVCGRLFPAANGYPTHIRSCKRYLQKVGQSQQDARARTISRPPTGLNRLAGLAARFGRGDVLDSDVVAPGPAGMEAVPSLHRSVNQVPPVPPSRSTSPSPPPEEDADNPLPAPPEDNRVGRGFRVRKPVERFQDFYPSLPLPLGLAALGAKVPSPPRSPSIPPDSPDTIEKALPFVNIPVHETNKNSYGLYKRYQTTETLPHDPDAYAEPRDLIEEPAAEVMQTLDPRTEPSLPDAPDFAPYPNLSSFQLGDYFWSDDNEKSKASFQKLISIVSDENFSPADVCSTNWAAINNELGCSEFEPAMPDDSAWRGDGTSWKSTPVTINVPFNTTSKAPGSLPYTLGNLRHRPLVPLIKERIQSSSASGGPESFHHIPFELRWRGGDNKADTRVYSELYNSDAFLEAYREIQHPTGDPPADQIPQCIVGLMFASDGTHLANFGNAKLWPLYLFFANDSKYRRGKSSLQLGEQVAYFEKLPDSFKDFVREQSGKGKVGKVLLTHCQREAFHEQWVILLDDEFLEAYVHGIEIECFDGVTRRFFPRIFTYTADYPEKILIASIRNLGKCPCPRCLVRLDEVHRLGKTMDRRNRVRLARADNEDRKARVNKARYSIYHNNRSVNSKIVEAHLDEYSLVPSQNAFSERLSSLSFDFYNMLVPDVMHEVELGVWKSLFIQILRLLDTEGGVSTHELDARFRQVPTFGKDTIRRFRNNVSEMKQLAARDYEDLLQCCIPVVEGLLLDKKQGERTLKLLFTMAHWHGLAKLRQHTEFTLQILDDLTSKLGEGFRKFVDKVCIPAATRELPRETAARKRREAGKLKKGSVKRGNKRQKTSHVDQVAEDPSATSERKHKTLNLRTYKFHALGHLVPNIRRFGTSDNYSSQGPESYHRCPKRQYRRTAKRRVHETLSRIQTRQARLRRLRRQLLPSAGEGRPDPDRKEPYFVGKSQNAPVYLEKFLVAHREDTAARKFLDKLKVHLLPRIRQKLLEEAKNDPSRSHVVPALEEAMSRGGIPALDTDHDRIFIDSNRLYEHKLLHVNYTSYDLRREQDILNPTTSRRELMTLAHDRQEDPEKGQEEVAGSGRFCYGRLLRIYHANVVFLGEGSLDRRSRKFDFLLVRWYATSSDPPSWSSQTLDTLEFPSLELPDSVGFLDPALVLRACHIIPRFSAGHRASNLHPKSELACAQEDWNQYYVNRFVDRDMLMRYHWGLGIGHLYSHGDAPAACQDNLAPVNAQAGCSLSTADELPEDDPVPEVVGGSDSVMGDTDSEDSECGLDDRQGEDWDHETSASDQDPEGLPEPDSEVEGV